MPLPGFNEFGDLPDGRHIASLDEVLARFGAATPQRVAVTDRFRASTLSRLQPAGSTGS